MTAQVKALMITYLGVLGVKRDRGSAVFDCFGKVLHHEERLGACSPDHVSCSLILKLTVAEVDSVF